MGNFVNISENNYKIYEFFCKFREKIFSKIFSKIFQNFFHNFFKNCFQKKERRLCKARQGTQATQGKARHVGMATQG
jgi:hypothetical protein